MSKRKDAFHRLLQMQLDGLKKGFLIYLDRNMTGLVIRKRKVKK